MGHSNDANTGSMYSMPAPGAGYLPSYQISCDPYLRMLRVTSSTPTVVNFPNVTKFFQIFNYTSGSTLRISENENGVNSSGGGVDSYFVLSGAIALAGDPQPQATPIWELRTIKLAFLADAPIGQTGAPANIHVGIVAGMTTIPAKHMIVHTSSDGWSFVG